MDFRYNVISSLYFDEGSTETAVSYIAFLLTDLKQWWAAEAEYTMTYWNVFV